MALRSLALSVVAVALAIGAVQQQGLVPPQLQAQLDSLLAAPPVAAAVDSVRRLRAQVWPSGAGSAGDCSCGVSEMASRARAWHGASLAARSHLRQAAAAAHLHKYTPEGGRGGGCPWRTACIPDMLPCIACKLVPAVARTSGSRIVGRSVPLRNRALAAEAATATSPAACRVPIHMRTRDPLACRLVPTECDGSRQRAGSVQPGRQRDRLL